VERDPRLAFRSDHREGDFIARPSRDPTAQARLRERLRAKYGLRDLWVGLFVDASRSYAVKLDPAPDAGSEEEP
jgi:hypothetical protein